MKGLRDAAIVAATSDLCARVSEVASLRCRDVRREEDGSGRAEVWSSKTGTARTGYLRGSTCRRLWAWIEAAGIGNGSSLFRAMDRHVNVKASGMQPRAIADVIRQRAADAGLDASGHSLRVGSAVSMASRGASLVAIQQAGGWRSPDMPAHYARRGESAKRAAASTISVPYVRFR